jgi:hypothetical protein
MAVHWDLPISDLRVGDVLTQECSRDEVLVTAISAIGYTEFGPRITISGQLIRGFGRSKQIRQWNYPIDQLLDIRREDA